MIGYENMPYGWLDWFICVGILVLFGLVSCGVLVFIVDAYFGNIDIFTDTSEIKRKSDKRVTDYINEMKKGASNLMYTTYGQKKYSDVPVVRYMRDGKGGWEQVMRTETFFADDTKNFTWKWIDNTVRYGWVQDAPPPEPCIIYSEGTSDEVDRILSEYNENKTPEPGQ